MDITLNRILSLIPKKPDGKFVHGAKKEFCDNIGLPANVISEWQGIVDAEARTCGAKTLKNAWFLLSAAITFETQSKPPAVRLSQVVPAEQHFLSAEQIIVFTKLMKLLTKC